MSGVEIQGVAHLGIRVHELSRSRAFYELLGFEFILGPVGPEPVAMMNHPSGVEINFILNAAKPDSENILMDVDEKLPGYTHVALAVASVADAQAHLAAHQIPLSGGPVDYPGGAKSIFVRDPDRNVVELYEYGSKIE